MTAVVDQPMSDKQLLSIRESTDSVNIWEGSVRSGKTIASLFRWLLYVAVSKVRGELIVVSRTRASAARNVFGPLMDPDLFGPWAKHVSYTPGADYGYIFGRKVWVLGSSDRRSENVLRGLTCGGAYIDEITLLQEDFFFQLLNRRWEGAKVFGTTNPDAPAHWLKAKFLDRFHAGNLPDWRVWKFFLDDNPQLSEARKAAIRRENTGLFYRRNVLGEWVAAEGAIFDMWDPDRHVVKFDDLPPIRRFVSVAIDYGTQHPTAALALGLGYDRRLYLMDELRIDSGQAQQRFTDAEQAKLVKAWLKQPHMPEEYGLTPEWTIADQAGASFREELSRDPGAVHTQSADKDVKYGIGVMASLLGSGDLLVSDRCTGFITEVSGYSWDPKAALRGEDAPIKTADDSLDAARYAVVTTENLWRDELRTPRIDF